MTSLGIGQRNRSKNGATDVHLSELVFNRNIYEAQVNNAPWSAHFQVETFLKVASSVRQ